LEGVVEKNNVEKIIAPSAEEVLANAVKTVLEGGLDPSSLLPTLSPADVHKNILRCHCLRNRVDLKLLGWIFVLVDKEYCKALGCSSPVRYVIENLHYEKTEAYDILEVARALSYLPHCRSAFEVGEISWAKIREIARVASPEHEREWLLSRARDKSHYPACRIIPLVERGRRVR
jgi:hypothetical protein